MGLLLDLLKSATGEWGVHSAFGRWCLAVSRGVDGANAALTDTFTCPAAVAVNDLVYVTAAGDTVDKATADQTLAPAFPRPGIGFVISKPTPTSCVVQSSGLLPNTFVGLTPGMLYYMGLVPGALVVEGTLMPGGSTNQQVGVAKNATELIAVILEAV
jgi:hypothetical protein